MDTIKIKTFLQVEKEGSFAKAAEKLFITPAAVKKQIDALEEELDTSLFFRTSFGCQLTPAGAIFKNEAAIILKDVNHAVDQIHSISSYKKQVRIGHSVKLDYNFLSKLTDNLFAVNPDYYIRFIRYSKSELLSALHSNKIDCFFILNPHASEYKGLRKVNIGTVGVNAVMHENHPLTAKDEITAADLLPYNVYVSSLIETDIYLNLVRSMDTRVHILDRTSQNDIIYLLHEQAVILYPCPVRHDISIPYENKKTDICLYYESPKEEIQFIASHLQSYLKDPEHSKIL